MYNDRDTGDKGSFWSCSQRAPGVGLLRSVRGRRGAEALVKGLVYNYKMACFSVVVNTQ